MNTMKATSTVKKVPKKAVQTKVRPQAYKKISCLTQLSMNFFLLINVKMLTIVGILTFMSRKNNIIALSDPVKDKNFLIFLYLSI